MNYSIDIGQNLTLLGLLFLILKYLLPVIIGALLLIAAYFGFRYFTTGIFPINVDKNWLIVIVCTVLILLLIIAAR